RADAFADELPLPCPPGARRSGAARRATVDLASFDRMSVLTAELKRLVASGARARLRLGAGPELAPPALARWLRWV
ncbi:MAG: hypothetical protein HY908_13515, partial [Myxococcales bacterium]|nr:hypothetical protein [Myxococcales bacterium]